MKLQKNEFVKVWIRGDLPKHNYFGYVYDSDSETLILYLESHLCYDGFLCVPLRNIEKIEENESFREQMIGMMGRDPLQPVSITIEQNKCMLSVLRYLLDSQKTMTLQVESCQNEVLRGKIVGVQENRVFIKSENHTDRNSVLINDIRCLTFDSYLE